MKILARFSSWSLVLSVVLFAVGCGGGGGTGGGVGAVDDRGGLANSGTTTTGGTTTAGALDPGGRGLLLDGAVNAQGAAVTVGFASAVAVNDRLQVAGFAETVAGGPVTASLWTVNDTAEPTAAPSALLPRAGSDFSAASGIDQLGAVVGKSSRAGRQVAVLWPAGASTPVDLPLLSAADTSAAFQISSDGRLIVGEALDATFKPRAVIWVADAQGSFSTAPLVLPVTIFSSGAALSDFSSAYGVARVGSEIWVVGEASDGLGVAHAALWRSADGSVFNATDLGAAGELASMANAVNAAGQIAGESETAGGVAPILWTATGTGTFQRTSMGASGRALAANDLGRFAGWAGSPGLATLWTGTTPAALYDSESQAYALNGLTQPVVVGRSGAVGFVKRCN